MSFKYYEDPILGKGRAADVSGGTGGSGTEYIGGTRIAIGGETISFVNSASIVNVTGNSVTLQPDTAYKITAISSAVTLNANVPAAGQWAYEGHAEIFVAGTGYIVTGANVVLANPLEPDAVNNCVLRFHDGTCIIDVEDHVYGYIVTAISGTTQGTLHYGITSATENYIAFDATMNGSTIDLGGTTASIEKHIVGNGYNETTLTGAVDCGTSKFTVSNLSLNNVVVGGGTMTLGDAFVPSGSTVTVSGGGLAVEKVTGAGSESVIDLGGTHMNLIDSTSIANISGCVISGGSNSSAGGALYMSRGAVANLTDVAFIGNATATSGGAMAVLNASAFLSNCTFSGNTGNRGVIYASLASLNYLGGCVVNTENRQNTTTTLAGSNKVESLKSNGSGNSFLVVSSGAVIDLQGNETSTPIEFNGGITVSGGCTVINSAGLSVSIAGGTYTQINNDGTTVPPQPEPAEE